MAIEMTEDQKKKNRFPAPVDIYETGTPTANSQNTMNTTIGNTAKTIGSGAANLVPEFGQRSIPAIVGAIKNNTAEAKTARADAAAADTQNALGEAVATPVRTFGPNQPGDILKTKGPVTGDINLASNGTGDTLQQNTSIFRGAKNIDPMSPEARSFGPGQPGAGTPPAAAATAPQTTEENTTQSAAKPSNSFAAIPGAPPTGGMVDRGPKNYFGPDEVAGPNYISKEEAHKMGLGRKAWTETNRNESADYHARLAAATQRNNAELNADAGANTAAIGAQSRMFSDQVQGQTSQNVAGINAQSGQAIANITADKDIKRQEMALKGSPADQQTFALRAEYTNPNTTPDRKKEIERTLLAFQGKQEKAQIVTNKGIGPDGMTPVQESFIVDPTEGTAKRITGQGVDTGQGGQVALPPPKNMKDAVKGQLYKSPDGKNLGIWDGSKYNEV